MTLTQQNSSLSHSVPDRASAVSASDSESGGDESLPPHTSEIGTLKKLPNHGTAWLGSSSGVYFVNTVRRAFSAAFVNASNENEVPASEDILTGEDDQGRNYNGPVNERPTSEDTEFQLLIQALGRPPTDRKLAMELVTTFFRHWHPLFPFLHGPQFLKDMDDIYTSGRFSNLGHMGRPENTSNETTISRQTHLDHRKLMIFQIIINLASLDRVDLHLPVESRIKSTSDVTRIAGFIATTHDLDTIQACLASELYLVATISLRQASTVAGIILRLIYHAGLHRCPLRYAQLSIEDCEIRKRIFWSAYALDRHLSLSLGDPITVQDSDIDVCLSGKELHKAVARELLLDPSDEIKLHLPARVSTQGKNVDSPKSDSSLGNSLNSGPQAREKQQRESAMTAYVHYGKLTGEIIEIFHKSLHARFPKQDAIMYLLSDIDNWWNQLPASLTADGGDSSDDVTAGAVRFDHKQLAPFFMILHQQLSLLLHRPRLSLDQSTAEFQHGLQVCIKASRTSLSALKKHKANGQSMLLPGLFSAAWMSGLIIAFACQLGKYSKARACTDISTCLTILESVGCQKWFTVKNCHKVLSLLLRDIKSRKASTKGFLSINRPNTTSAMRGTTTQTTPRKRARSPNEDSDTENLLHRDAPNEHHVPGSDSSIPKQAPINYVDEKIHAPAHAMPQNVSTLGSSTIDPLKTRRPAPSRTDIEPMTYPRTNPNDQNANMSNIFGPTLYNNSQNATFAQSNHNLDMHLPELSETQDDDPMFWGNLDYNISDIFSAASWENMTGAGGPLGNIGTGSIWNEFGFGGNTGSTS